MLHLRIFLLGGLRCIVTVYARVHTALVSPEYVFRHDILTTMNVRRTNGAFGGTTMRKLFWGFCLAGGVLLSASVHAQQKLEIRITRQPSIIYMPTYVMEANHLIEARAAALGVPDLKVDWINFNGGGNATDALLSNSIDVVNTGVGNMLLLWDRTRGGVKGIVATWPSR